MWGKDLQVGHLVETFEEILRQSSEMVGTHVPLGVEGTRQAEERRQVSKNSLVVTVHATIYKRWPAHQDVRAVCAAKFTDSTPPRGELGTAFTGNTRANDRSFAVHS